MTSMLQKFLTNGILPTDTKSRNALLDELRSIQLSRQTNMTQKLFNTKGRDLYLARRDAAAKALQLPPAAPVPKAAQSPATIHRASPPSTKSVATIPTDEDGVKLLARAIVAAQKEAEAAPKMSGLMKIAACIKADRAAQAAKNLDKKVLP